MGKILKNSKFNTMSKLDVGADDETTWRKEDEDNGGLEP
jgi:hypothetical protein